MELLEQYLDFGSTLYVDNWHNSITLAEILLERDTFIVGTLRGNRKRNPTDVTKKKLGKGEIVDHLNMVNMTQRRGDKIKPQAITEYNGGKFFIDGSDQMNSYNSFDPKWYFKVAFYILLNVAVINALSLNLKITQNKIIVTAFREAVVEDILSKCNIVQRGSKYQLQKVAKRSRCNQCYYNMFKRQ